MNMTNQTNIITRAVSLFRPDRAGLKRLKRCTSRCTSISDFLQLIQQRKWRKVKQALRSSTAAHLCSIVDPTGLSALGAAIGCNAPYEIIKYIYDLYPNAAAQPDDYGSLPLHIGCLNGCQPNVVELMLSQEHRKVQIASHLDMNKFCPLHYAVDFICSVIRNDIIPSMESQGTDSASDPRSNTFPSLWLQINDDIYYDRVVCNAVKIVEVLCECAPECVTIYNCDNETPIDILQSKKLLVTDEENYQILDQLYKLMKQCAIECYKKQKAEWEDEEYEKRLPSSLFSLKTESDGSTLYS